MLDKQNRLQDVYLTFLSIKGRNKHFKTDFPFFINFPKIKRLDDIYVLRFFGGFVGTNTCIMK